MLYSHEASKGWTKILQTLLQPMLNESKKILEKALTNEKFIFFNNKKNHLDIYI